MPTSRTAATLPAGKYSRPARTDDTLRAVSFTDEDGATWSFDFSDLTAASGLVDELIAAVVAGSSPGGRWRTRTTVDAVTGAARHLAAYLEAHFPDVASIADVSPEVWWAWRAARQKQSRWPGMVNLTRALLSESPKLPELTRRAMRAKASKPRKRLPENDAYSAAEFNRIRTVAKTQVRQAASRIDANLETLHSYRQSGDSAVRIMKTHSGVVWTAGSTLDYLSRTGSMPSLYLARCAVAKGAFDLRGVSNPAQALFPSIREIYCLMVLLVCERGFNLSVMDNLTIHSFAASDPVAEEPVHTVNIDKPRRGPQRHSVEILGGEAGKLWEKAVGLTQACRDTLDVLGSPSEKLLIAHRSFNYSETGPFRTDWLSGGIGDHTMATLGLLSDEGRPLPVSLRRLRLSEQVLNQRARQNSEAVSEDVYRHRDSSAAEIAADTIIEGQQDALDHAQATVSVRALTTAEVAAAKQDPEPVASKLGVSVVTLNLILAGQLDTPTCSCTDFHASPFADAAGDPCPASFLACLACPNSVVTPAHLPRLVALHEALDNVATIVPESRWRLSYAEHYARLTTVLHTNATAAEIAAARQSATDTDRTLIERLLNRKLDA
ncbi:MAG: hypothetical protein PHQ28_03615 [Mycobacterium sp.]|nr:hypothetical protein [Mycobacterium sp.]